MFDEAKRKWVIYRRIIPEFSERMIANDSDRNRPPIDRYNRSYAYAESEDLKEWKNHQFILAMDADDPADTELYQFACHKFGATYVGYVSIFYLRRPQPIDIHLATSRDGIHFTRVCRGTPFIPSGPLGYYDFMAMACSQPRPIVVNDTVYIYYAALNFPHDVDESASPHYTGGVALATLEARPIRLAGNRHSRCGTVPRAHETVGRLASPAVPERRDLGERLDPCGSADSRLAADPGLHCAEAREIQGDALDHPVRWSDNADLGKLLGQEIRLKFHMTCARLHAMTMSDQERPLGAVEAEYRSDPAGDSAPKQN